MWILILGLHHLRNWLTDSGPFCAGKCSNITRLVLFHTLSLENASRITSRPRPSLADSSHSLLPEKYIQCDVNVASRGRFFSRFFVSKYFVECQLYFPFQFLCQFGKLGGKIFCRMSISFGDVTNYGDETPSTLLNWIIWWWNILIMVMK